MNKLTALNKLSNAYWYVRDTYGNAETAELLEKSFGYIRRSLRIEDLRPAPQDTEGFNGRMPTHF